MIKSSIIIAGALVIGGAIYASTRPSAIDPQTAALAEALALHARAVKAAVDEECAEARSRLTEWRTLREAGTPAAEDSKKARKVLRQLVRSGCRAQG